MGMFLDGCFECDVATTIQISIDYGMHKSDEFSPCLCWVLAMLQSLGFPYMAGECIAASSSPHGDHVDGERKRTPLPSAIGRAARSRSCGCAGLVHLARQSVSNRCNHRRAHRSDRYNHQSSGREEVVISKDPAAIAQISQGPNGEVRVRLHDKQSLLDQRSNQAQEFLLLRSVASRDEKGSNLNIGDLAT
jgi:hypothetical protein